MWEENVTKQYSRNKTTVVAGELSYRPTVMRSRALTCWEKFEVKTLCGHNIYYKFPPTLFLIISVIIIVYVRSWRLILLFFLIYQIMSQDGKQLAGQWPGQERSLLTLSLIVNILHSHGQPSVVSIAKFYTFHTSLSLGWETFFGSHFLWLMRRDDCESTTREKLESVEGGESVTAGEDDCLQSIIIISRSWLRKWWLPTKQRSDWRPTFG